VLDEVVKLLRATIPATVDLSTTLGADLPPLQIDSTELHQVLLNLGTNAWHALGSRTGRIRFALEACTITPNAKAAAELPPGRYVRITVSDNGKGIPADVMPRIFDPFFTTKAPGEGTGLGLSVVHGIVSANGGAITVSSTVNVGTTFELLFPAADPDAIAATPAKVRAPLPPAGTAKGEHILFVDDEESLVMVAERVFGRAGYTITTCLRPKQALAIFRTNPEAIHLVISDLSMPEMSGLDLATELLRIKPTLPIILTSGYLRPGETETALQAGVREIVEKPNTPHDLLPIVSRLLKAKASATEPSQR
jgi:CheY-like chemotaxis protein